METVKPSSSTSCRGSWVRARHDPGPLLQRLRGRGGTRGAQPGASFASGRAGFTLDFAEIERKLTGDEIVILGRPNNPTARSFLPAPSVNSPRGVPRRSSSSTRPSPTSPIRRASSPGSGQPTSSPSGRSPSSTRSRDSAWAPPSPSGESSGGFAPWRPPWSVNSLAQAAGAAALRDREYEEETRRFVSARRGELTAEIGAIPGLAVYPGTANFLLVRIDRGDIDAPNWQGASSPTGSPSVSATTSSVSTAILPRRRADGRRERPPLPLPP